MITSVFRSVLCSYSINLTLKLYNKMHWKLLFEEDSWYNVFLASTTAFIANVFIFFSFFAALLDNNTSWSFVMISANTLKQCIQRLCFVLAEVTLVSVW